MGIETKFLHKEPRQPFSSPLKRSSQTHVMVTFWKSWRVVHQTNEHVGWRCKERREGEEDFVGQKMRKLDDNVLHGDWWQDCGVKETKGESR